MNATREVDPYDNVGSKERKHRHSGNGPSQESGRPCLPEHSEPNDRDGHDESKDQNGSLMQSWPQADQRKPLLVARGLTGGHRVTFACAPASRAGPGLMWLPPM